MIYDVSKTIERGNKSYNIVAMVGVDFDYDESSIDWTEMIIDYGIISSTLIKGLEITHLLTDDEIDEIEQEAWEYALEMRSFEQDEKEDHDFGTWKESRYMDGR